MSDDIDKTLDNKDDGNVVSFEEERKRLLERLNDDDSDIDFDSILEGTKQYKAALELMNERHAFVNSVGGRPQIMCNVYNAAINKYSMEFRLPEAIQIQYSNQVVVVSGKPIPMGNWWIRHPERREYNTIFFDPEMPKIHENNLNLWEGLNVTPKKSEWRRIIRHIWKVLCNKDKKNFKYAMRWFAWTLQNPGKRAEVAMVFKGNKGAGKGVILTEFVKIFGQHGMSISSSDQLTGKHNGHLERVCFLFADEAFYPGWKDADGVLKTLITEPSFSIEPKFAPIRLIKNCLHIVMATNNDWAVNATVDERRYFVMAVNNKYAKGRISDATRENYFNLLYKEIENGGREAMVDALLNINLGEWHPRSHVPITKELYDQIEKALNRPEKIVLDLIEEGYLPGILKNNRYLIKSNVLRDHMIKNIDRKAEAEFKKIQPMLRLIGATPIRDSNSRFWEFPPLCECRGLWDTKMFKRDWNDDGDWEMAGGNY